MSLVLRSTAVAIAVASLFGVSTARAAHDPFFGVVPQGGLAPADCARMAEVAGTLRLPVLWYEVEPGPGEFDFSGLDQVVGCAADQRMQVLPFVYGSPPWVAGQPSVPPLASASMRAAWSRFLGRLVDRYGPGGEFWDRRARREPIHRWQIWNEPNFGLFWSPRPEPAEYAKLLRLAATAIRARDPHARILLGGVAPIAGAPRPWIYLRDLLEIPDVWRYFDVVAVHPYAASLSAMAYQIELARLAMANTGDASTPIQVTEFGVASSGPRRSPMVKTPTEQADFLRRAYRMLVQNRRRWRIVGADWFAWRDGGRPDPSCDFCQGAGLFTLEGRQKPAWTAYREVARRGIQQKARGR